MILVSDDDRIARFHPLAKRLRQDIGVLRRGGPETQFFGLNSKHRGQAGAGLVHLLATKAAGFIRTVGLNLALVVEARQPVDHRGARV